MMVVIRLLLAVILLAYPLVVYYGLLNFEFWQVALMVISIALIRLLLIKQRSTQLLKIGFIGALILLCFGLLALILDHPVWLKIYPIAISVVLLYAFASSLLTEKSMIQRFAEIREKNITAGKKIYMKKLTLVWCGFFICNAIISAFTLFLGTPEQWVLYNGLISYLLMGVLAVGELAYRHAVVLKRL